MIVSVNTDAGGAAELVAAVARVNIRDALRSPSLRASLLLRTVSRPDLLVYADDASTSPFKRDEWAAWSVLALRYGLVVENPDYDGTNDPFVPANVEAVVKRKKVRDDCEGLTAAHLAALVLVEVEFELWAAITHPRISTTEQAGTAHAYIRLGPKHNTKVFDPSVLHTMRAPREGWYDQVETKMVRIEPLSSGVYDV